VVARKVEREMIEEFLSDFGHEFGEEKGRLAATSRVSYLGIMFRDFATSRLRDFATSRLRDFATSRLRDFAVVVGLHPHDGERTLLAAAAWRGF